MDSRLKEPLEGQLKDGGYMVLFMILYDVAAPCLHHIQISSSWDKRMEHCKPREILIPDPLQPKRLIT
jgi:hypothetical protein